MKLYPEQLAKIKAAKKTNLQTNNAGGASANPISKNKTPNRNDVCPCGSGKKYKQCCSK